MIIYIFSPSESGGVEDDEEEVPITNIDDASFDEEPSTNTVLAESSKGTRTPLAITHSYSVDERDPPHSPSSNDEKPLSASFGTSSGRSLKLRPSSGERMRSKSRHHHLSNIAITSTSASTPGKLDIIIIIRWNVGRSFICAVFLKKLHLVICKLLIFNLQFWLKKNWQFKQCLLIRSFIRLFFLCVQVIVLPPVLVTRWPLLQSSSLTIVRDTG